MEWETFEDNMTDIALQEQTFYDSKPSNTCLIDMANQIRTHIKIESEGDDEETELIKRSIEEAAATSAKCFAAGAGVKPKKKKVVKFLNYVQVQKHNTEYETSTQHNTAEIEDRPRQQNLRVNLVVNIYRNGRRSLLSRLTFFLLSLIVVVVLRNLAVRIHIHIFADCIAFYLFHASPQGFRRERFVDTIEGRTRRLDKEGSVSLGSLGRR